MKTLAAALLALAPLMAAIPEPDKGKSFGNPSAPVMIEVFSDLTCPHCKAFHDQIVPLLMKDFITPGKVYLVNRDFPLSGQGHLFCRQAHAYANAAARIGKYKEVVGKLWEGQASWGINGKVFESFSGVLTADEQKKIQVLVKDPGVTSEVQRELDEGISSGISSTPTLIVTKGIRRIPVPRADNYNLLKSMLNDLLK